MKLPILPYDVILHLAKFVDSQAILALTKTCRYFAPVLEKIVDLETGNKCEIARSIVWKMARETQFPNKPYLWFRSCAENYFIAKTKQLAVLINQYGEECDDVYEYDMLLDVVASVMYNDNSQNGNFDFTKIEIKDRYLLLVS